tara:strand:+ start:9050 stop:10213 length:1164 start_codon:yes stop_codon:yes gene_type:complete
MSINIKNKHDNIVLIVGGNHINTLGTIRSLGELGVTVYVLVSGYKYNFIQYSRYVKKIWIVNSIGDSFMAICKNIISMEKAKPIIIPCSDDAVYNIDKNIDKLINRFIFPNIGNKQGMIAHYMNKNNMVECARKSGLTTPRTQTIDLTNIDDSINNITFPSIIKPLNSLNGQKNDIQKIYSINHLYEKIENYKERYDKMIIQEYIESHNSVMLEIIGCVLSNGQVYIPGILEKIRHYPNNDSSGSYFRISENRFSLNLNLIKDFLLNIGYTGIFDIEFKYSRSRCYFIEVNFRNGGTNYLYTQSNANISYVWYLDSIGALDNKHLNKAKIGKFGMYEERDWKNIGDNISFIKWVSDIFKTNVFTTFNTKDIKPFFIRLLNKILLNRK